MKRSGMRGCSDARIDPGVGRLAVDTLGFAAQQAFEFEAAAFGHGAAAQVGVVGPDFDAAGLQLLESQPGQQIHGLGRIALAQRAGSQPETQSETPQRPVDAVQPGATEQLPTFAGRIFCVEMKHQLAAQDEIGLHPANHRFGGLHARRVLCPSHPGPQVTDRPSDRQRHRRPLPGLRRGQDQARTDDELGHLDQYRVGGRHFGNLKRRVIHAS